MVFITNDYIGLIYLKVSHRKSAYYHIHASIDLLHVPGIVQLIVYVHRAIRIQTVYPIFKKKTHPLSSLYLRQYRKCELSTLRR